MKKRMTYTYTLLALLLLMPRLWGGEEKKPGFCRFPVVVGYKGPEPYQRYIEPPESAWIAGPSPEEEWVYGLIFKSLLEQNETENLNAGLHLARDLNDYIKSAVLNTLKAKAGVSLGLGASSLNILRDSDKLSDYGQVISRSSFYSIFSESHLRKSSLRAEEVAGYLCENWEFLKTSLLRKKGIFDLNRNRERRHLLKKLKANNLEKALRVTRDYLRVPADIRIGPGFEDLIKVVRRLDDLEQNLGHGIVPSAHVAGSHPAMALINHLPFFPPSWQQDIRFVLNSVLSQQKKKAVKILHSLYEKKQETENQLNTLLFSLKEYSDQGDAIDVVTENSDSEEASSSPGQAGQDLLSLESTEIYQELERLYWKRGAVARFVFSQENNLMKWIYLVYSSPEVSGEVEQPGQGEGHFIANIRNRIRESVRLKVPGLTEKELKFQEEKIKRVERIFYRLSDMIAGDGPGARERLIMIRQKYTAGNLLLLFCCEPEGVTPKIDRALEGLFFHLEKVADLLSGKPEAGGGERKLMKGWFAQYIAKKRKLEKAINSHVMDGLREELKKVKKYYNLSWKEGRMMKAFTKDMVNVQLKDYLSDPLSY